MLASFTSKDLKDICALFFLDTCCSPKATVFNCKNLIRGMWNSTEKETITLGGAYTAPYTADLHYFGTHDFDEDLPMSVLSWYWLESEMHANVSEPEKDDLTGKRQITFRDIPVVLSVSWIDGVLAGSLQPLLDYHERCKLSMSSWRGARTDEPSELLKSFKIVNNMSPSEIRRLDSVHRALQTTWASSEQDLITRIKSGELVGINFNEKDVATYFTVFEKDLQALKGREKD